MASMIALLTIFVSSFVIALSGVLMPGPLLTATISESSHRGASAGPMLILGHGILELALLIGLLLGLAPFLKQEKVFSVIALAGGGILLWMAAGMFRSLRSLSLSWDTRGAKHGHLVITGALLSVANPYWIIWWATLGLGYILHSTQFGLWGISLFFAGHILADFAWYSTVSTAVARGRHFLSIRLYKGVIGTCASFLVMLAFYFVYGAFSKFVV
jgi:threonine/homoserine/homoserine lactone efflux protein